MELDFRYVPRKFRSKVGRIMSENADEGKFQFLQRISCELDDPNEGVNQTDIFKGNFTIT